MTSCSGASRALFPSEMGRQHAALLRAISTAVERLDRLDTLAPALEELGRRHVDYGTQRHHYALVGEALVDTLREGLAGAFTAEVKAAWRAVYGLLTASMLAGAEADRRTA